MVAVDAEKQETWMVFQIYFQLINYFLSLSALKMEEHPRCPAAPMQQTGTKIQFCTSYQNIIILQSRRKCVSVAAALRAEQGP